MIGSVLGPRAQPAAQLEAVHPRQADVENRKVGQRRRHRLPGGQAVVERQRLVAVAPQREADALADRLLVFDDGDAPG